MEKQAEDYSKLNHRSQLVYGRHLIDGLEIKKDSNVLAVGCGTGDLAAYVAKWKVPEGQVTAFDPDKERLAIAKKKFSNVGNISFHEGTAVEFLRDKANEFDLVYSSMVFHWVPIGDRIPTLECMYNALKPGGVTAHQMGEQFSRSLQRMVRERILSGSEIEYVHKNLLVLSKEHFLDLAGGVGFQPIRTESVVEKNEFANIDEFLSWSSSSLHGRVQFNERYKKREREVDIGLQKDGSVFEEFYLFRAVMEKPFVI